MSDFAEEPVGDYESVKNGQVVWVTADFNKLKAEWAAAELGTITDEDLKGYCGCSGTIVDIEDDDTVQLRWESFDSQWIPVLACVKAVAPQFRKDGPATLAPLDPINNEGGDEKEQFIMDIDSVKPGQTIYVTSDLEHLKREWVAAELGALDDATLKTYLGQAGLILEVEDDDTVQLRWETYETQWMPVTACSTSPPAAKDTTEYIGDIDSVAVGQTIYVTNDLDRLKKEWAASELGPLDDATLKTYLGQAGKILEIEEDDDSAQLRWETFDTQWIPVLACSTTPPTSGAAGGGIAYIENIESVEEGQNIFVTPDLAHLKKEWAASELGPLDDATLKTYLSQKGQIKEIEEDDDTVHLRWETYETQWIPIKACIRDD